MQVFNDFTELKAAVGTEVGVSDWTQITQDRIDKFAEATNGFTSTRNAPRASRPAGERSRMDYSRSR
jgi:hypothetical protein